MRRNQWIALVLLGTGLGLAAGWAWVSVLAPLFAQARVATGYMAKTVCSCLYVEGRGLAGCQADALLDHAEALSRVRVAADEEHKRVRASLFPFSAGVAAYEEGFGCAQIAPISGSRDEPSSSRRRK